MIQLQGVSKWYHERDRVLDKIDLNIRRGEFLYVVGGSGAGKTSLLKMIATEEAPSAGQVSLFGYDLKKVSPRVLRSLRQAIGFIPQDVRLISDLSVYDNIALSHQLAGRRIKGISLKERIDDLLEGLSLHEKRQVLCAHLSGGEAQRVAVARALIRAPELIVADEPTGAQDHDHVWSLMNLFMRANQSGTTMMIATHDREIVKRVRKNCATLQGGRIVLGESGWFY